MIPYLSIEQSITLNNMTDEQKIAPAAAEHEVAADLNVFEAEREMDEKNEQLSSPKVKNLKPFQTLAKLTKKLIITVWITFLKRKSITGYMLVNKLELLNE